MITLCFKFSYRWYSSRVSLYTRTNRIPIKFIQEYFHCMFYDHVAVCVNADKIKTMLMQNFGGQTKEYNGIFERLPEDAFGNTVVHHSPRDR